MLILDGFGPFKIMHVWDIISPFRMDERASQERKQAGKAGANYARHVKNISRVVALKKEL
jgi:hypothetical protein